MSTKILEALAQMDPDAAEQWTASGKPSMAFVEKFANDESITRQDVEAAAPDFSRTNPVLPESTADDADAGPDEADNPVESVEPSDQAGESATAEEGSNDSGDSDEIERLKAELAEKDKQLKAASPAGTVVDERGWEKIENTMDRGCFLPVVDEKGNQIGTRGKKLEPGATAVVPPWVAQMFCERLRFCHRVADQVKVDG